MYEKGAERTGRSGRGYSEWAWPLRGIHLRKREDKQGDRKGDGQELTCKANNNR